MKQKKKKIIIVFTTLVIAIVALSCTLLAAIIARHDTSDKESSKVELVKNDNTKYLIANILKSKNTEKTNQAIEEPRDDEAEKPSEDDKDDAKAKTFQSPNDLIASLLDKNTANQTSEKPKDASTESPTPENPEPETPTPEEPKPETPTPETPKDDELKYVAPQINYTKSSTGKFVFVNNPETLDVAHLANSNRLLYKDSFSGNMELYYEHIAQYGHKLGTSIYYAIRFYNPSSAAATLIVNKSGNSTLYWDPNHTDAERKEQKQLWTNTWKEYYTSGSRSFTIPENGTLVLYHANSNDSFSQSFQFSETPQPIMISSSFDGVLNLTANKTLNFEVLAYNGDYNNTLSATYPGNDDDKGKLLYTGYVNHSPNVYNNISFTINDSIKSGENLKVNVNGAEYDSWITNIILPRYENAYKYDTVNLIVKPEHGEEFSISPPFIDARTGNLYNVANWAVHYHENITLINAGKKQRKVSFIIKTPYAKSINIVPSYKNLESIYRFVYESEQIKAWTVIINPGEKITVPTTITLGGMSNGVIEKMVQIEE